MIQLSKPKSLIHTLLSFFATLQRPKAISHPNLSNLPDEISSYFIGVKFCSADTGPAESII